MNAVTLLRQSIRALLGAERPDVSVILDLSRAHDKHFAEAKHEAVLQVTDFSKSKAAAAWALIVRWMLAQPEVVEDRSRVSVAPLFTLARKGGPMLDAMLALGVDPRRGGFIAQEGCSRLSRFSSHAVDGWRASSFEGTRFVLRRATSPEGASVGPR